MRWLHVLLALALNAVPIVGVLAHGWSVPTILVLYWVETLAITAAHCVRIGLHRRLSRAPGRPRPLLAGYALLAGAFSLAQGVFVLILAFSAIPREAPGDPAAQFHLAQFAAGAQAMIGLVVADLLLDLVAIRDRDEAWIRRETARREGRVLPTQLAILGGAFAIVKTQAPVPVPLVLLGPEAPGECIAALAPPPR